MEKDKLKVKDLCLTLGMFKSDGVPLPLVDHFVVDGGATRMPEHAEKYLDIEGHSRAAVERACDVVRAVQVEAELSILANAAKRAFVCVIGSAPVRVRMAAGGVNPARVYSWCEEESDALRPETEVDEGGDQEMAELMANGFLPLDSLSELERECIVTDGTPQHSLAVEEYERWMRDRTGDAFVLAFAHRVSRDHASYLACELEEHSFDGTDLLLGGLRASISDDEAINIAVMQNQILCTDIEGERVAIRARLADFEVGCQARLLQAVVDGEDGLRWRLGNGVGGDGMQVEGGCFHAENLNRAEAMEKMKALRAKAAEGTSQPGDKGYMLAQRLVPMSGAVVVDCWSCKSVKMSFPSGSKFAGHIPLAAVRRADRQVDHDTPVIELGGVGKATGPKLIALGLTTIGSLAALTETSMAALHVQMQVAGVKNLNLRRHHENALALLATGVADEDPASEDEREMEDCLTFDDSDEEIERNLVSDCVNCNIVARDVG
ncbi:hypothetical protein CYMTET_26254 [Cymbomonas tetramitiformis]|uniref:Uncharacterized protein n=1 Tax=Cymbomonas tetramitiformis TaxID=36881 RepID=A0AAE0KY79_9CHLO|nr:hypothetical protein CYMTET_26254 [Cymbomonas tetramitiformis]